MSDLRKAAEVALEALETLMLEKESIYDHAIQALRQALAQSEQDYERGFIDGMQKQMQSTVEKAVNAMTKREWVGLTDEDLKPLCEESRIMYGGYVDDFAKAIEAKLKEKNT